MQKLRGMRIFTFILALCLIVGMIPVQFAVEVDAVDYSQLTCASFISDTTRQRYIDVMMRHYITTNSQLSSTLSSGYSVVFMFEGGSDNYSQGGNTYVDADGTRRTQAVVIVVKNNSSGNPYIAFHNEDCSSIPDDANWCTGAANSGSTTVLDGIYKMYTTNHMGSYAAYNTDAYTGWYNPPSSATGYANDCNGINIHTRSSYNCGGQSYGYANSAGCQVISYGYYDNAFNDFMKVTAGITWTSYSGDGNSTFATTGTFKGYYVLDRQLGLISPSGVEYGSGSLTNLYPKASLDGITAFSTSARATADFTTDYASKCTSYPAHCKIKITNDMTPVMSQPCAHSVDATSGIVEVASKNETYTATKLYQNTNDELWYEVTATNGEIGHILATNTSYVDMITSDITLTGATMPNGHVQGSTFTVSGTIATKYNALSSVKAYVFTGHNTGTINLDDAVTGAFAGFTGTSYNLAGSSIDDATAFNELPTGKHTYLIAASYQNYYTTDGTTVAKNARTKFLARHYFSVVSSAVDQSTCSHSYSDNVVKAATCTSAGTTLRTCSKCGIVTTTNPAKLGHSYGSWSTVTAATCTTDGSRTRTCTRCSAVQTEKVAMTGHSYQTTEHAGSCTEYERTDYKCSTCGHSYTAYAEDLLTEWSTTAPTGVDESLVESKTQYRYANKETTTSTSSTLSGYTQSGSAWSTTGTTGSVSYVKEWPSGFRTAHSLYTKYNNTPKSDSTSTNTKVYAGGEKISGWLYYHWCGTSDGYSSAALTSTRTTFHAFHSTKDPATNNNGYDPSDSSYSVSNTTCSTSSWFFVVPVYTQSYITYNKIYSYYKWGEWSAWGDTVQTASDAKKVETQTVYRYVDAELDHTWVNGACSSCGVACTHNWSSNTCTICGMTKTTDVSITLKYPTMSLEGEVRYNVYYALTNTNNETISEMGLLTWTSKPTDATYATAENAIAGAVLDSSTGYYMVQSKGIAAKDLGDNLYLRVYAKLADGTYVYSPLTYYNAKFYANDRLTNSSDQKLKALCVALLNYGAEAQTYFDYKTDALVNSGLTAEQQALVNSYSSDMVTPLVSVDSSKIGTFAKATGGYSKGYPSTSLEGAFKLNYYFTPKNAMDDVMTMYFWDLDTYNSATELTAQNADAVVTAAASATDGEYYGCYDNIASGRVDETIFAMAVYESDGIRYCTGVIPYSLSSYCVDRVNNGTANMQALAKEIAVYGSYAKAYLNK